LIWLIIEHTGEGLIQGPTNESENNKNRRKISSATNIAAATCFSYPQLRIPHLYIPSLNI
jgi:hypothetical protein